MRESEHRDHLFVSHAGEDAVLARWLTLKLTAAGYRVWCDQFKLLGGESYPKDIDRAIKDQTFRMIALLSRRSIAKPNPLKERTLALNIARQRRVDFLIPINVDGLNPIELDWMTSDITFIPFHRNWAEGLYQLLKKLRRINAPRSRTDGPRVAAEAFLDEGEIITASPEVLFTNELRVETLPEAVYRFTAMTSVAKQVREELAFRWPFYAVSDRRFLAFHPPPATLPGELRLRVAGGSAWPYNETIDGIPTYNVVTHLLKRHLSCLCLQKGMKQVPDRPMLYFPRGLLPKDKIHFCSYTDKKTTVLVVGNRSIPRRQGERTVYHYYLACVFRVLRDARGYKTQLRLRLHLTDASGNAIPGRYVPSRRKRVTRAWWNHQWLNRLLAVCSFLADGEETITIGEDTGRAIVLDARPIQLAAPFGIDESRLGPVKIEDIVAVDEEEIEEEERPQLLPDDSEEDDSWATP